MQGLSKWRQTYGETMAWLTDEENDERPLWRQSMDQSARSSLADAIGIYLGDDAGPQRTRRLVLSLHQAIELFLKSRLAREDALLIQRDVDGADVLHGV